MNSPQLQVCNLGYLNELAHGDDAFIREMVEVFLEENGEEIEKLDNAIRQEDYYSVRQIAHKLRSSVPYVGLDLKIGDELQELEDHARLQDEPGLIRKNFEKIRDVCAAAIEELKQLHF